MGRDHHSPPRHGDGTLLLAGTPQTKLRTLLAVLSLGGLLRLPCHPRGLTPSGLCCPHDVPPAPLSPGCRRTRWSRIFDGQVTMPYRERGACISQGGYILLPRSLGCLLSPGYPGATLEQKVPPTRGTRVPLGHREQGGHEKKSKFIYGYIESFDPPLRIFPFLKIFTI